METELPKVSVIIPFYNCSYVDQAISSVLKQTYQNVEVIVVDDGSTSHQMLVTPFLKKIHYIYKKNGGTATALNRGLSVATGDLIAWLSSDDVFHLEKLEKQVEYMKRTNADLVYTNFSLIDEKSEVIGTDVGVILDTKLAFLKYLQKSCPINGSTVLVKKEVFTKVGPFNPALKYTQDYDMWLRVASVAKVVGLKETLLNYRKHAEMGSHRHHQEQMKEIEIVKNRYKDKLHLLIQRSEENST
ncbi:glycosyltransferase [Alkalihalobacillus macyae]|uniref:glycosyltransferase n=1 Tax=Guptibacillus hwajinpoensis TaxID=208199 RepID=UPI00273C09A0|nr:glycosyltransferase [Alkalihalobacillus macyae]MDP4550833.1 glycosyltransferase [Alkalihalobacillus macyae]